MGLIGCLLLYGCATMNKNDCLTADWQAIGYEDGGRGYGLSNRFSQHRKACSKHGISAEFNNYKTGYDNGVRSYCTPERGYTLGKNNRGIPTICPADLVEGVRKGYNVGHDIYLQKQALKQELKEHNNVIDAIDDDIAVLIEEREEHEEYLHIAEHGLTDPKSTRLERVLFYTQRNEMRELIREKDNEIDELESTKQPYYDLINSLNNEIRDLDSLPMPKLRP